MSKILIVDLKQDNYLDKEVNLTGWVQFIRAGKKNVFVVLRDHTGYVQVYIGRKNFEVTKQKEIDSLVKESYIKITGILKQDDRAPYIGREISCSNFEIIGSSVPIESINRQTGSFVKFENRHLVLRGQRLQYVMQIRSEVCYAISDFMRSRNVSKVTPPTLTQQEVEGGSTLFKLDYYGEEAMLTQSSQLYLETAIPSLGPVWCELPSFRNEKSATRRHLSEFTHIEAELPSIGFEELLEFIESMVKYVAKTVYQNPKFKEKIDWLYEDAGLKHNFEVPDKPFKRMKYSDAIKWLNEKGIKLILQDGTEKDFEYGDDIPEAPERLMTDTIGEPIFLTHFPKAMKAFYMEPDNEETLSVDLLLPNVGEIVGGSMRITDYDTLVEGFKKNKINTSMYDWYIDQRKYGSCPHGGFGFGTERFLMWLTMQDNVKDCCLYPRYMGRIKP